MPKIIVKVPPSKTEQTVTIDIPDSVSVPASTINTTVNVPPSAVPVPAYTGTPVITGTTPIDTVPPVVVDPPPVTGYTVTYQNGFDKASDLSANQLGKGSISTTETFNSPGSFRSLVNYGDPAISSGFRSEQQYNGAAQNPKEGRFSMNVKFGSWEHPGWGNCFPFQFHPGGNDNGGSALFFMESEQQKWNVYCWQKGYQDGYQKCDPINPNQWYLFEAEWNWSLKSDGYFRVFIDKKLYWSFSGATQISSDQPYLKIGQNQFGANAKTAPHGMDAYIDNFVVSKKN